MNKAFTFCLGFAAFKSSTFSSKQKQNMQTKEKGEYHQKKNFNVGSEQRGLYFLYSPLCKR